MEEKETGIEEESMGRVKREGSKGKDRKGKRREAQRGERMNKKSSTFVHKYWCLAECAMHLLYGSSYSL